MAMVHDGQSLPVCLRGDRLEFVTSCDVVQDFGGTVLTRYEMQGNSWDGATIPRALWAIAGHPFLPEYRWASYWHDRLCESARSIEDRTIADAVFLKLLKDAGVSKWRRLAMWLAVRFYGLFLWKAGT